MSKLCGVDKVCVSIVWEEAAGGGGRSREQARECPTKNKNPTQRCGELLLTTTTS